LTPDQVNRSEIAIALGRGEISPALAARWGVSHAMPPKTSGATVTDDEAAKISDDLKRFLAP
ncbi:MAG: hypothetical protein ACIALR_08030, partial [Blastopirellula sp. JB062]